MKTLAVLNPLKFKNITGYFFRSMPIVIVLFMLTFQCSTAYGQPPGYLGKRFFVEGNLGANLSLLNNTPKDDNGSNKNWAQPMIKLSANWVTQRYRFISLEGSFRQFFYNAKPLLTFPEQPQLTYRIRNQSIGFGFYRTRKKSRASIAPLGVYFGYKVIFNHSQATPIKYTDNNEKFEDVERAAYNLNYKNPNNYFLGLAMSFGRRTIIKDKFTLNYMIDLGYDFSIFSSDQDNVDDRINAIQSNDIKRYNAFIFNFTIGAGYLIR